MKVFIIAFLLFLVFVAMVGAAIFYIKKNDPERLDSTNSGQMQAAQDFLPFVDIKDQMILMGNHNYHTIIDVSSVNYALRNEREKSIIELTFQNVLNGLTHPITLFISTREMDYTKLVSSMKVDYERTYQEFPEMRDYLQQNLIDMKDLSVNIGETRHKKKYIIVPYDANVLTELNDEEKYDAAREVLLERSVAIQNGLERISGLKTRILDSIEIMDLLVQTYHRDGASFAEDLYNGQLTSIIVDSQDVARPDEFTPEQQFDVLLTQMQAQLEAQFLHNENVPSDMKKKAHDMWGRIHAIRQSDELDGLKINHQKERERAFEEQIKSGEVTIFGTTSGYQNIEETETDGGREHF